MNALCAQCSAMLLACLALTKNDALDAGFPAAGRSGFAQARYAF